MTVYFLLSTSPADRRAGSGLQGPQSCCNGGGCVGEGDGDRLSGQTGARLRSPGLHSINIIPPSRLLIWFWPWKPFPVVLHRSLEVIFMSERVLHSLRSSCRSTVDTRTWWCVCPSTRTWWDSFLLPSLMLEKCSRGSRYTAQWTRPVNPAFSAPDLHRLLRWKRSGRQAEPAAELPLLGKGTEQNAVHSAELRVAHAPCHVAGFNFDVVLH